jgi:hypothetical protein
MGDALLRELERRWKASRSVEDEARLVAERVRVGDLTRARLELAAYAGHAAACLAAESVETASPSSFGRWLRGLERWGSSVCVLAAVLIARSKLPAWTDCYPKDRRPEMALDAAEAWACSPNTQLAREAALSATGVRAAIHETASVETENPSLSQNAAWSAERVAALAANHMESDARTLRRQAASAARTAVAMLAPTPTTDATVRLVRERVALWALGRHAPSVH